MPFIYGFVNIVPFNESNDSYTDLPLGYNATIECVDLSSFNETAQSALRSIHWTDPDGTNVSYDNTLILNVVPSLDNTEYTCTAEVDTNPMTCSPDSKTIIIDTKSM